MRRNPALISGALACGLAVVACGSASAGEAETFVTATRPPFARPLDDPSEGVVEREAVPFTTPGPTGVPPTAAPSLTPDDPQLSSDATAAPAPDESTGSVVAGGAFDLIPVDGAPPDRPDYLHADLNLALRGFTAADAPHELVAYNGGTDPNAPKLNGLFGDRRVPAISSVYQVYDWIWDPSQCDGTLHGCRGGPDDTWPVTLAGFATSPGEPIYPPSRGPEVYPGGYVAMVLFAEQNRITLAYTRSATVATGYAVHLESVCVDPRLLALYRAQTDEGGWLVSGQLPALSNGQALGTACAGEIQVAVRDGGSFMDPRSGKDWW